MSSQDPVTTKCPASTDCQGAVPEDYDVCFVHLPTDERKRYLERVREGQASLNLGGLDIDLSVLEEVLRGLRKDGGRPNFGDEARFGQARFASDVIFEGLEFGNRAFFEYASFEGPTSFKGTTFGEDASFDHAAFKERADFFGVRFGSGASLYEISFPDKTSLRSTSFGRGAIFVVSGVSLDLDRAAFVRPYLFEVRAESLSCNRFELPEGGELEIKSARVDLRQASFGGRTVISPPEGRSDAPIRPEDRPVITSLRGVDVSQLVLTDVNVEECLFDGAHNLDRLRLEGNTNFRLGKRGQRQILAEEAHLWEWEEKGEPNVDMPRPDWGEVAALYRSLRKAREDAKDDPGANHLYWREMEMRRRALRRSPGQTGDGSAPQDTVDSPRFGWAERWTERFVLFLYWLVSGYGLRVWRPLVMFSFVVTVFAGLLDAHGFEDPSNPCNMEAASQGPTLGGRAVESSALPPASSVSSQAEVSWWPSLRSWVSDLVSWDAWLYSAKTAFLIFGGRECELTTVGEFLRIPLRVSGAVLLALAAFGIRSRLKR